MRELTPELRAVHDLARAAQGAAEVSDLLRRICTSIVETFGFERTGILRYHPETDAVEVVFGLGLPKESYRQGAVPLSERPLYRLALERGEPVFVADLEAEPLLPPQVIETFDMRSLLAVPLVVGGNRLGLVVADRGSSSRFELEDAQLDALTTIGAVGAVFFERALAHEELARLDDLKAHFVGLVSHELRTPAAVVHGIAATLHVRGADLSDDQRASLGRTLYEQTDRLRLLIDQLLDLSRLEAGGIRIEPQSLPVRTRLQELVLTVAGERSGDVTLEVSPELETFADPNAFDRIVSNLIANAFRYGAAPITISAEQPDRHLRLTVEDRGEGVPPEFVPHLFERFTRGRASQGSQPGAGLGLAIAQSFAHAHGGELLYEPARPHGARFRLVLPAARV